MNFELLKWSADRKGDLVDLCNSVDRTYLSDRLPNPYTDADADFWLNMVSEHDGADGLFRAISVDGKIVGNITIECKADVYSHDCEIGYMLLTEYWSQGIMTEAAKRICVEAFDTLDIARITGIIYTPNTASQRVLEKSGFVREGVQRNAACKNGKFYDLYIYGKLRENNAAVSVDLMRRSDAYTIENFVPSKELMYRAAYGVYRAYAGWRGKKIAILVGGGNNGGDGYALAGILKADGIDSVVLKVSDKLSEDGRYYCEKAEKLGVPVIPYGACDDGVDADKLLTDEVIDNEKSTDIVDIDRAAWDLSGYDVIVDCILGTGFKGEVRGKAADAIKAINAAGAYVISVDINSGMNGDTGEAALAVHSDLTVSIGYYKQGLFKGDAEKYIGSLTNVDIGIVLLES